MTYLPSAIESGRSWSRRPSQPLPKVKASARVVADLVRENSGLVVPRKSAQVVVGSSWWAFVPHR